MKKMQFLLFALMILTACNQENTAGSYAMITVVNGIEYNGTEENINDYQIKEEIGKITKKVPADVFPGDHQSNFFEEGSIIYSIENEMEFIVIEDTTGKMHLLQKAPGDH